MLDIIKIENPRDVFDRTSIGPIVLENEDHQLVLTDAPPTITSEPNIITDLKPRDYLWTLDVFLVSRIKRLVPKD